MHEWDKGSLTPTVASKSSVEISKQPFEFLCLEEFSSSSGVNLVKD